MPRRLSGFVTAFKRKGSGIQLSKTGLTQYPGFAFSAYISAERLKCWADDLQEWMDGVREWVFSRSLDSGLTWKHAWLIQKVADRYFPAEDMAIVEDYLLWQKPEVCRSLAKDREALWAKLQDMHKPQSIGFETYVEAIIASIKGLARRLRTVAEMIRQKEKAHETEPYEGEPSLPDSDIDREMARQRRKMKWLAEAMTLVQQRPDLSDAAIARAVGKAGSTLSRNKTYREAAKLARERQPPPKGTKDQEGNIEAEYERDDFSGIE